MDVRASEPRRCVFSNVLVIVTTSRVRMFLLPILKANATKLMSGKVYTIILFRQVDFSNLLHRVDMNLCFGRLREFIRVN